MSILKEINPEYSVGQMVFLIVGIGTMCFANTADLLHDGSVPPRTITKEGPICTPTTVDYVVNRRCA